MFLFRILFVLLQILESQYECEPCRVCDDISSGYHFGVFTCEACKGFFRRYSKKSTILEPCVIRCSINKNNRNNCAACRFDKCKCVGTTKKSNSSSSSSYPIIFSRYGFR